MDAFMQALVLLLFFFCVRRKTTPLGHIKNITCLASTHFNFSRQVGREVFFYFAFFFLVEVVEWVRGLGRRMGPTLSSCTRQDIKFAGDCKTQITIFNITASKIFLILLLPIARLQTFQIKFYVYLGLFFTSNTSRTSQLVDTISHSSHHISIKRLLFDVQVTNDFIASNNCCFSLYVFQYSAVQCLLGQHNTSVP